MMMNYKMQEAFAGRVWLITPSGLHALKECVNGAESMKDIESYSEFYGHREMAHVDENGVGHLYIENALLDEVPTAYEKLGFVTSYATLHRELDEVMQKGARAIMLHVNSPGGMVSGCIEFASRVAQLAVPTVAYMVGTGCSAAYKISAGCDAIITSESAQIGNIGSIISLPNTSEREKAMGISRETFTNEGADLKSTGYLANLSESQRDFLQEQVNKTGASFRSHVESSREVSEEVFRAGWYSGQEAVDLGLADLVGTKEDALDYLAGEI